MPTAAYFQAKAEQCRGLVKLAADQQIIDQLQLWIADFETDAATAGTQPASDDRCNCPSEVGESYRALAARCREMAQHTAKPDALLRRALAFDASASALDCPEPSER